MFSLWFSGRSKCGKHIVFDGRYLHAAPRELSLWAGDDDGDDGAAAQAGAVRHVTFVVNTWLNWKPRDAVCCPDPVVAELNSATVPLHFSDELQPIPTVPMTTMDPNPSSDSVDTIDWQFEASTQMAVITLAASVDSIRQMGAQSGASLHLRSWSEPKAKSSTAETPAPELVQVRTRTKPVLATGFHSGVAKTVNHLFEWTAESLCDTSTGTADGKVHAHTTLDTVIPAGDPKLTECDESTLFLGLFLCGPQVRQDDQVFATASPNPEPSLACQRRCVNTLTHLHSVRLCVQIFCFVYKYRQRFAVVMDQIASRLGLQTEKVVSECRKHHMFLDDASGCEATCGSTCERTAATQGEQQVMESDSPLVRIEARVLPKKLKKPVAEDLRTRGLLVNKAQPGRPG